MWATVKTSVVAIHNSFHKSGTIVFARVQVLIGAVWAVLTATDLAPLIGNPKYVTAWLVFSGVVTEMSRRSRTVQDAEGHLLPSRGRDDDTINVTVNNVPGPAPVPAPASPLGPTSGTTK